MRNIFIWTLAILFSMGINAQEAPSMTKAQAQELLPTLQKEIEKLENSIEKNQKNDLEK